MKINQDVEWLQDIGDRERYSKSRNNSSQDKYLL